MKLLTTAIFVLMLAGCSKQMPCVSASGTVYRNVTMVTVNAWPIGEARWCSFDGEYNEMHCFAPEDLPKPKTNYLVGAHFDKPVLFDANKWSIEKVRIDAFGSVVYPYSISCRLDSMADVTCHQELESTR